jgi:hypothetical protein
LSWCADPRLSVVLVAFCDSPNLRMALDHQRMQTIARQMELILVTSSKAQLKMVQGELEGFCGCSFIEMGHIEDEGSAKAAGVKAARAQLVAFTEDHSFPESGCAEALVRAHSRGDFAAVGPVMDNANPRSAVSWGCFLVFYSQWMAARKNCAHLPSNHSCYQREILLGYGDRLAHLLQAESVLHWDLVSRGYRLRQEPAAKVYHLNFSKIRPLLLEHFLASRVFAAGRARSWGTAKRTLYALGSPLLPIVRLKRIIEDAKRIRLDTGILAHAFVPLMLNLCAGSAGEMLGYSCGQGEANKRLFQFEQNRHLEVTSDDLRAASRLKL